MNFQPMDVYLNIRFKKYIMFINVQESMRVHEFKEYVQENYQINPEDQILLFKDDVELLDEKCLGDYGLNSVTSTGHAPITLDVVYKNQNGVNSLSNPPELLEAMTNKD